jgi:hypothetical protein
VDRRARERAGRLRAPAGRARLGAGQRPAEAAAERRRYATIKIGTGKFSDALAGAKPVDIAFDPYAA